MHEDDDTDLAYIELNEEAIDVLNKHSFVSVADIDVDDYYEKTKSYFLTGFPDSKAKFKNDSRTKLDYLFKTHLCPLAEEKVYGSYNKSPFSHIILYYSRKKYGP